MALTGLTGQPARLSSLIIGALYARGTILQSLSCFWTHLTHAYSLTFSSLRLPTIPKLCSGWSRQTSSPFGAETLQGYPLNKHLQRTLQGYIS